MKLNLLERKAATVGALMGMKIIIGSLRRRYRAEDKNEQSLFSAGYLSAQQLWDRLDFVETALRLKEYNQCAENAALKEALKTLPSE